MSDKPKTPAESPPKRLQTPVEGLIPGVPVLTQKPFPEGKPTTCVFDNPNPTIRICHCPKCSK